MDCTNCIYKKYDQRLREELDTMLEKEIIMKNIVLEDDSEKDYTMKQFKLRDAYGLSGMESRFVLTLMEYQIKSYDELYTKVYGTKEWPDLKVFTVMACKINKKLKPLGVKLVNVWGRGYMLPNESIQKLQEIVA